jgi:hypothetical protein
MSRSAALRRRSFPRNLLSFPRLAGNSRGGLGLAAQQWQAWVWFMGLGLWTVLSGGCVTDTIPFDREPIEPPDIRDSPTSPRKIGDVFFVDASKPPPSWPMQVLVREKDPQRKLIARQRIYDPSKTDLSMSPPPFTTVVVPLGSLEEPELREVSFEVRKSLLNPDTCYRLELVVSGSFGEDDVNNAYFDLIRVEDEAHDIDSAKWWVWEGERARLMDAMDSEAAQKLLLSCDAEAVMQEQMSPTTNGDVE